MHRFLQLACYASTLLGVCVGGYFFTELSWQAPGYWNVLLNGKPQPSGTEFFAIHYRICPYLLLFPWLAMIGLPLIFPSSQKGYWDTQAFYLRLTAFVFAELAIGSFVVLCILAPAFGMLKSLPSFFVPFFDSCLKWSFWFCAAGVSALALMRALRTKAPNV